MANISFDFLQCQQRRTTLEVPRREIRAELAALDQTSIAPLGPATPEQTHVATANVMRVTDTALTVKMPAPADPQVRRAPTPKPSPILTCATGTNADLFPSVLAMYVPVGSKVADVTFGRGVFWKQVNQADYVLSKSDLTDGIDFRRLPYDDGSYDALVLDPPYLNGGANAKKSLNRGYRNPGHNSYQAVLRLYVAGALEAHRVLRRDGVLIVKAQPCVADHVQYSTHVDLIGILPRFGLRFEDEFVLHAAPKPIMRHAAQQHARKNHSYFLVFRKVR